MQIDVANNLVDEMGGQFQIYLKLANELTSPNPEDTLEIRCAIVGFSCHAKTEDWSPEEYEFVSSRLCEEPNMYSESQRQLLSMCFGGMCGLKAARKLSDAEFQLADAQLPGLLLALESAIQC
jgi:hypothetical protein